MVKKIITAIMTMVFAGVIGVVNVSASGGLSVSPGSLTITTGGSANFTVTALNAAGKVDVASSDASVARVSVVSEFLDNSSVTVRVDGVKAGAATITVRTSDMTTYDDEDVSGTARTVTVKVNDPVKESAPASNGGGANNGGETSSNAGGASSKPNGSAVTKPTSDVPSSVPGDAASGAVEPLAANNTGTGGELEENDASNNGSTVDMFDHMVGGEPKEMSLERQNIITLSVVAVSEAVIIVGMLIGFGIYHHGHRRRETCQNSRPQETSER